MWEDGGNRGRWDGWGEQYAYKKKIRAHTHAHADTLKKTFINHPHLNVNKWQMARLNRLSGPSELVRLM